MSDHFADRLLDAIHARRAPVCVGFDPLLARLPSGIARTMTDRLRAASGLDRYAVQARAVEAFGRGVIDAVAPFVPAIKINIAFFEPFFGEGIRVYHDLIGYARDAGLIVIGDVKRADIGHTTARYADAQLGALRSSDQADAPALPDAVTVNPYFGIDGVAPFIERAREHDRGVFVLVQTSNESAAAVQGLRLADRELVSDRIADMVEQWAADASLIGSSGYSCVGAVVSPRDLQSTRRIRARMPHCLFLVPGFGAQGRTADEVAECFKEDGTGAIVNASRSVIYAFEQTPGATEGERWKDAVADACRSFIQRVRTAVRS